ncbi:MAG: 3'(2'),5'-bisphosphate nucleotidase CysQ [Alphaproteobacteria bacterium]|nr:3'(2'),5'-bisphosphate nucleotidase CysQ [Alphaproteobacteria bacterium]
MIARLVAIAQAAGAAILEHYVRGAAPRLKADRSPVTAADEAAEALILERLGREFPEIPVVAEEAEARGLAPANVGARFFLVDPLDGTKEFVAGNGEFTVNIGLIENARPVAGVVHAPTLEESWWAERGRAWHQAGNAAPVAIAARRPPSEGLTAMVSRSHMTAETEAFLARLPIAARLVSGSSVKFCRIAEGRADIYPRHGPTREWDSAAAHAVLAAAGGSVRDFEGRDLSYGKPGWRNPAFVARGRGAIMAEG